MRALLAATAIFVLALPCAPAFAQMQMDWRLAHNFPFFKTRKAFDDYVKSAALATGPGEQVTQPGSRAMPNASEILAAATRVSDAGQVRKIFHENTHEIVVTWAGGPTGECQLETPDPRPSAKRVRCDAGTERLQARVDEAFSVYLRGPDGQFLTRMDGTLRDLTIVGIGDSYSAGEGNPDVASVNSDVLVHEGGSPTRLPAIVHYSWTRTYWPTSYAQWLDQECHRSLYSYQVMAAARLALDQPKRLVRFAHWSCSGAEVFDGLLFNQGDQPQVSADGTAPLPGVRPSQLDELVQALCRVPASRQVIALPAYARYRDKTDPVRQVKRYMAMSCEGPALKKPDMILMSVGGNDVDFRGVVVDLLAPAGAASRVRALVWGPVRKALDPTTPTVAGEYIAKGWLQQRNDILEAVLSHQFHIGNSGTRVLQLNYPNPLFFPSGATCSTSGSLGADALAEMLGAARWRGWNLVEQESALATTALIVPLQAAVRRNALRAGWHVTDQHLEDFQRHGICSPEDRKERQAQYQFPAQMFRPAGEPYWEKVTPSQWSAYARTERWVRMPNDSFSTQITSCVGCPADPRRFTGTMHPNAYGQARFAQSILTVIRDLSLLPPAQ